MRDLVKTKNAQSKYASGSCRCCILYDFVMLLLFVIIYINSICIGACQMPFEQPHCLPLAKTCQPGSRDVFTKLGSAGIWHALLSSG
jgi:hypothetical protein